MSAVLEYAIALGSNLGDRERHLRDAVGRLGRLGSVTAASPVFETAPVACPDGSGAFLNAVVMLESGRLPDGLMTALRGIEQAMGRPADRPVNAPRVVDLDILCAGDVVLETPLVRLPHPRLHERRFVLEPLAAVQPALVIPGQGATSAELLARLTSDEPPLREVRPAGWLTRPD